MKTQLAQDIIDCLPKERTIYRYFKDGYALNLLRRYLARHGPQKIATLRGDFSGNEGLVEEIQTDWLRNARRLMLRAAVAERKHQETLYFKSCWLNTSKVKQYLLILNDYQVLWTEATLNAAINFIFVDRGISTVSYHSQETRALAGC